MQVMTGGRAGAGAGGGRAESESPNPAVWSAASASSAADMRYSKWSLLSNTASA